MTPLRVLHLMSCRGWSSDAYWTGRAVAALRDLGHRVTLVTQEGSEERVGKRLRQEGVEGFETLDFGSGFNAFKDARAIREIRKLADGHDLIHVHRGKEHWLAAFANRGLARPCPLVRTRHIIHPVKSHLLNRWLYRRTTDMVVAVTERIRQRYLGSGLVPPEKIVTLYGGVDTRSFSPEVRGDAVRAKLNLPPGTPLLGLVGGLRVMKGHQTLVRAMARLKEDGRNCRALFVGQGSQEAVIRREIKKHDLGEEIVLAGFLPDLSEAMAAFDIALYVPYESDGMGRVVFEYLAMGKPLIATRVGVVPEILTDGLDALTVPPGDPESLARAIRRLIDDRGLTSRLGAAGRALVESKYSGACLARNLDALYRSLIRS